MAHLRREVHSYLTPSDYRRLEQEAAARGASVSKCVADCLGEYFALRVEMASVVAAPGQLGEPHQGLIQCRLGAGPARPPGPDREWTPNSHAFYGQALTACRI